jgi:hypothetical protein
VPAILEFLARYGPSRQFFPCYTPADIFNGDGLLKSLTADNLLMAFVGGQLAGILAGWDQTAFRQSVIHGYKRPLKYARPVYNAWARARGLPSLPAVGTPLRYLTGALPIVADHRPGVLSALLAEQCCRAAGSSFDYLLIGLHESDPLLAELRGLGGKEYMTRLFLVCWQDGEPLRRSLDGRPPYLELGCL